jgi:hypothetical protein
MDQMDWQLRCFIGLFSARLYFCWQSGSIPIWAWPISFTLGLMMWLNLPDVALIEHKMSQIDWYWVLIFGMCICIVVACNSFVYANMYATVVQHTLLAAALAGWFCYPDQVAAVVIAASKVLWSCIVDWPRDLCFDISHRIMKFWLERDPQVNCPSHVISHGGKYI